MKFSDDLMNWPISASLQPLQLMTSCHCW